MTVELKWSTEKMETYLWHMTEGDLVDRIILNSKFTVPAKLVPIDVLDKFKAKIIKDEEEEILSFFTYNEEDDTYSFAAGNLAKLAEHFDFNLIDDRRPIVPAENRIKFNIPLRPGQIAVVKQTLEHSVEGVFGFGQIEAPPRFGKTVVMAFLTCHLGLKTILLVHQLDLANQAFRTFRKEIEIDGKVIPLTNIDEVEERVGRKVIGICNKVEDLDKYDVCFITYQKFLSKKGQKLMEKYHDKFGAVFIDEIHKGAAAGYAGVISKFNSKYRIGVSGTIERKDGLHVVNEFVVGPVIAKGEAEQVPCTVYPIRTGVDVHVSAYNVKTFFTKAYSYLAEHEYRNESIANIMAQWAKAGHVCVALTNRVAHCDLLVKMLEERGVRAAPYHRKAFKNPNDKNERERHLDKCRSGETQVLIAYRTMMLGIDVPAWTALFNLMPIANKPNYYQELCRVRTPNPGKTRGYIIDLIDRHHILEQCYASRKSVYDREGFDYSN